MKKKKRTHMTEESNYKLRKISPEEATSVRKTQELIDEIADKPPSIDSEIFAYLDNLAKEKGVKFQHHESVLKGLQIALGNEIATINKVYIGGTAGHSDGKVVYRVKRSEMEKFPWFKATFKDLGLTRIIQVIEDQN